MENGTRVNTDATAEAGSSTAVGDRVGPVRFESRPRDETSGPVWFTAHLLYRGALDDGHRAFPLRERIVLLQATSPEQALTEAERLGATHNGERIEFPQGPGSARFVGVRKLVAIGAELRHTIEVANIELEVDQEDDVQRVLQGEFVKAVFEW